MAEILDLRGRELTVPAPQVLTDPSGRRARLLARGGRVLALIALLWVAGLVLAGLGILPAGDLPLGPAVAGPQAPSGWRHPPTPTAPSVQDLRPAIPANSTAASGYGSARQPVGPGTTGQPLGSPLTAARAPGSASRSVSAQPTAAASASAGRGVGTGLATATSRGHSGHATVPGQNTNTVSGNSDSSPGRVRQVTTPTGQSALASDHTAWTPTNGYSNLP